MANESDDSKNIPVRSALLAALVDETLQANRSGFAGCPPSVAVSRLHDPYATTQPEVVRVADPNAITEDIPAVHRPGK